MASQTSESQRLGELLVRSGAASQADVDGALALQGELGTRLGETLVRIGALSEENLCLALATQTGLDPLPSGFVPASQAIRAAVSSSDRPAEWWRRHAAVPWFSDDGLLHVAAVDPWLADLREATAASGLQVSGWHFLVPGSLERWQAAVVDETRVAARDERELRELAEDAPVIAFVNALLAQAVEARASDIHIEPGELEFQVRLRVDGMLRARQGHPMSRFPAVASRIKLISGLDIAERRLPQDGRATVRVAGVDLDARVSCIPAVHGESIVLRLLPKRRHDLSLELLGMEDDHLRMFRQWLQLPNGLILVTGPTGSGKSTTLYSALTALNETRRKIVTVEDPVELQLPDIVQIQTQSEIGYSFARALRSILRHDPDVIMVGEIRDKETAEIAIQAALTGHLVLATLHTNDALSAVTRLVDMGVEPFMVASSLRAVMAQRLVRRLCAACAERRSPEEAVLGQCEAARIRWRPNEPPLYRLPAGCPACQGSGYRGRMGIYELVTISPEIQHLIVGQPQLQAITDLADRSGRRSLEEDGLLKVAAGETSAEEVFRMAGLAPID